jgi:septum site-determining protein MinD
MQRVIGVLSGKGGVGKTVTAINLAGALHEFGKQATVVDADISSANLTVHLGLPDATVSLQDVLDGRAHIYKAIRVVPRGLRIVPAALSLEKSMADMSNLKKVIWGELEGTTFIDAPPGFSKETNHVMDACDDVVVVTNPDVPSITDAVKVIEISKRMKKNALGVVVTRVRKAKYEIKPSEIETVLDVPLLGVIPEDAAVKRSIFERTPLVFHSPHSDAAVQYRKVAARIADVDYSPPSLLALRRLLAV